MRRMPGARFARRIAVAATFGVTFRADAQATVTGHVRDPGGLGIAGADVRADGVVAAATTNIDGAFQIRGAIAPTTLRVRRIGFRQATQRIVATAAVSADLVIVLDPLPIALPSVTIAERQVPLDPRLAGFRDRMQKRSGHFFTRERIDALQPVLFTDLFRGMASVRIGPVRGTTIRRGVRFRGAPCGPLVVIDGFAAGAAEYDLDNIDPVSIEAVEVYMDAATAPAEMIGPPGAERCGVVAIWSRTFRATPRLPKDRAPAAELQRLIDAKLVFPADAVDTPATIVAGTFAPVYPESLWVRGTEGQVRLELVVDEEGAIEWQYVSVVSSSHPAFRDAVVAALASVALTPAFIGPKRVRQLLELPVRFERPPR